MFQSLVVLHCELDPNNKSKIGLLFKQVEAKIFCFRPETCFRPIFIFHNLSDIQHAFLEDITARIALGTKNCELFYGYEAFEFLLHWTVGLLNPKYAFNDRFVLGKCREIWTTFTKNDAERLQGHAFLQIMPALFEDAHIIRRAITNNLEKIGMELRIKKTNALCKSSRIARERDDKAGALKFIYSFGTLRDLSNPRKKSLRM